MKKSLLLSSLLLLTTVARAFTGEIVVDGIKYEISTKAQTANAIGPASTSIAGTVVIPDIIEYEGKTCYVNSVGGFAGCEGITAILLAEGITTIRNAAFQNCSNLIEINIPETICEVGRYAFENTKWLNIQDEGTIYINHIAIMYKGEMADGAKISIKEGTTVIADYCFSGSEKLREVSFPQSLKSIGKWAFNNCPRLISVSLSNVDIHYRSFGWCVDLKDVSLTDVRFIPDVNTGDGRLLTDYFEHCNGIESVYINCKEVDDWFENIPTITSLTLGEHVEVINPGAFRGCTGLTSIEFPNSINYLSGFSGCIGLETINIPSSVKEIGESAFEDCIGLSTLYIPANVETIGIRSFYGCSGLLSISLSEGLKSIGGYAFGECTRLNNLVIPNSVNTIGNTYDYGMEQGGSFYKCKNLESVILPNSVKEICVGTFSSCENLTKVSLPEGLQTIKCNLFSNCKKLNSVTIPSSVTTVYGNAFYGCKDLEEVCCYAPLVPKNEIYYPEGVWNENPFSNADIQYATLYVPAQAIGDYNTALYWKDFKEIIAIPNYEPKKCAPPKISYSNGKLLFTCDTEGAQFISNIYDTDIKTSNEAEIVLSATYHITVYATAPEHVNSDVVEATLCWIEQEPSMDGIQNGLAQIESVPVLIQNHGNAIVISGVKDGVKVSAFTVSGKQIASTESYNGQAVMNTNLSVGSVAIVKIGAKAIKVLLKN